MSRFGGRIPDQLRHCAHVLSRVSAKGDDAMLVAQVRQDLTDAAAELERQARSRPLTAHEITLVRVLARGLSRDRIAVELGWAPGTVASRLARLFERLGVATRLEAVAAAARMGLLDEERAG